MHAAKAKLTLILIVTLGLGFAIGYLLRDVALRAHFRGMAKMRHGEGITEMIVQRLNLTPSQKDRLSPLLKKYNVRLRTVHQNFRRELTATLDSMKNEFSSYLTAEQKKLMTRRDFEPGMMGPPGRPLMHMTPGRFISHILDLIEPTDAQRDTVFAILRKYAPSGRPDEDMSWDVVQKRMNSMFQELELVLTREQMLRIRERGPFFHRGRDIGGNDKNDPGNPENAVSNEYSEQR